jgi:hypothetical protein
MPEFDNNAREFLQRSASFISSGVITPYTKVEWKAKKDVSAAGHIERPADTAA